MTSGKWYMRDKEWYTPDCVAGHNNRKRALHRQSLRPLPGGPSDAFVARVRNTLESRRLNFEWLARQTGGYPYGSLFRGHRLRPEMVVHIAQALDLDLNESIVEAGYPPPDAVTKGIIRLIAQGQSRVEIAKSIGVDRQFIDRSLNGPRQFHREPWIRTFGPALGLNDEEIEAEVKAGRDGHSAAMRRGTDTRYRTLRQRKQVAAQRLTLLHENAPVGRKTQHDASVARMEAAYAALGGTRSWRILRQKSLEMFGKGPSGRSAQAFLKGKEMVPL